MRFKKDWPAYLVGGALLAAMLVLARDFGSTWDERALQKYGEQIWDFYAGKIPRSGIDLTSLLLLLFTPSLSAVFSSKTPVTGNWLVF